MAASPYRARPLCCPTMGTLPELLRDLAAAEATGDGHRCRAARGRLHRALHDALPEDPLVAASCLTAVTDDGLRTALEPLAARIASRVGLATALVVDGRGQGRTVEVLVELSPGSSGAWTPQPIERDARVAAQLAVAVALGPEAERWGVRWQVRGTERVRGSSIGLAVAVATRAAQRGMTVPPGQAFTGGVDLDGTVASVSGIPAKLRAAVEAGEERVWVPAVDLPGLRRPEGLVVLGIDRLEGLLQELFGAEPGDRRTARSLRPAWLLVPALAAWTGLLDPVDGLLQGALSRGVLGVLPAEQTAVLPLPETSDTRALRADYPAWLEALQEAGATAVVLDVFLGAPSDDDGALAAAIRTVSAAGMPVILPTRRAGGSWSGPASAELAAVSRVGTIELEADRIFGTVRRAPVQLRDDQGETRWHAAVLALSAHLDAEPALEEDTLAVGITRNPAPLERLWLPPVAAPERLAWGAPETAARARGRVVLVGRAEGHQDWFRTPAGPRHGVEIHAALVETLARQAGLRRARAAVDAGLAAGLTLLTWLFARALSAQRRWLALVLPLAGLALVAAVLGGGWLLAPTPLVLAALCALWAAR